MNKLIFENKTYLILLGENSELESQFRRLGDRAGFRVIKAESKQELDETVARVKNLLAVVNCSGLKTEIPLVWHNKYLAVVSGDSVDKAMSWLMSKITGQIPLRLAQLMENSISAICPRLFGSEIGNLNRNDNFQLCFTNLVTCDASADGFSAKALCEANFEGLRKSYPSLKSKSDAQLTDVFGEICNQILGVVNAGLRPIGLDPMISLPMGVELSSSGKIAQVDFMPMVRLSDRSQNIAIAVAIQIEAKCTAKWDDLSDNATDGDIEFFTAGGR